MANKQELTGQYTPLPGTEMQDLGGKPAPVVIVTAMPGVEGLEGAPEIVKLEIKHQATDFDDNAAGSTLQREGFIKFLMRREVPHRAVFLAFAFVIIGAISFSLGFVEDLQEWDPFGGFLFWGTGLILFIPGAYFCFKLILAYRAPDATARSNILREIPDL